jgi:hypothetical protein
MRANILNVEMKFIKIHFEYKKQFENLKILIKFLISILELLNVLMNMINERQTKIIFKNSYQIIKYIFDELFLIWFIFGIIVIQSIFSYYLLQILSFLFKLLSFYWICYYFLILFDSFWLFLINNIIKINFMIYLLNVACMTKNAY